MHPIQDRFIPGGFARHARTWVGGSLWGRLLWLST